jgi:hypothetical protein
MLGCAVGDGGGGTGERHNVCIEALRACVDAGGFLGYEVYDNCINSGTSSCCNAVKQECYAACAP